MRILHLLSSKGLYGAETMTLELIRQLHLSGLSVRLGLLQTRSDVATQIAALASNAAEGVHLIDCRGTLDFAAIAALRDVLDAQRIDLLHCHGYKPVIYGLLARRNRRTRLVASCHSWEARNLKLRSYEFVHHLALRRFDAAFAVSAPIERALRRHLRSDIVHRIANGIDVDRYAAPMSRAEARARLGIDGAPLFGFVGRVLEFKGIPDLIEAYATVRGLHPAARLVIVGEGDDRARCEELARRRGVDGFVHFLGTRADTPVVYAALDALVLPSYHEGAPMVLLEAMAAQLPIIATRTGEIPFMLDEGRAGTLVHCGDVAGLTAALLAQANDPARAAGLAKGAYRRVLEKFSSNAMAGAYARRYAAVMSGSPGDGDAPMPATG